MKYIKPYLIFTVLVWLPWGLLCVFDTDTILQIIGVTSVHATGNTDIRAMYGGVQSGIGLMAAFSLYDQRHFKSFLLALAFIGSGLALSRSYGIIVDGSGTPYTLGVIAYEYFAAISAITWLILLPRLQK